MRPIVSSLKVTAGRIFLAAVYSAIASTAIAQTCQTSSDLDEATRTALSASAQRYFDMAAKADIASMRQSSIPSLASDFSGIENSIRARQSELQGAHASVKSLFLLEADGAAPIPNAQFYCGVFGANGQTAGSAAFSLGNLPPGKYGVVILEAQSAHNRTNFSLILQLVGNNWKIGGLYIKAAQIGGHDSDWFLARAREYRAAGKSLNAWLFYLEARSLAAPLTFMTTLVTDKLYDESKAIRPADVPADGKTADLAGSAATYKLTAIFPETVGSDLDLIVKYQAADISNSNQAYQTNVNVMSALLKKFPELREAFAGIVARAVDPKGRDYGTLLAMKDIK